MPTFSFRNKILLLLIACMCMTQISTMLATFASTERTVRQSIDEDLKAAPYILDNLLNQRAQFLVQAADIVLADQALLARFTLASTEVIETTNHLKKSLNTPLVVFLDAEQQNIYGLDNADNSSSDQMLQKFRQLSDQTNAQTSIISFDSKHYQTHTLALGSGWLILGARLDDGLLSSFSNMTNIEISLFNLDTKYSSNIASTLDIQKEQFLIEQLQNFGLIFNSRDSAFDLTLNDEDFLTRAYILKGSIEPLFAIVQKSLKKEMQPFQQVDSNLLMLFAQVLLVAVLGSIFVSGSVVAPIKKLAGIAERIGKGNYDVDINVKSKDEIGQLGLSLNQMRQEISKRENKIVYQTHHDELTDLPNRYSLNDRITSAIHRASRNGGHFSLLMIDIARFKQINDTLGHHIGDQVLKITSSRLTQRMRRSDTLARMGGDDFMLLLEDTNINNSLTLIREKIEPLLHKPVYIDGTYICLKYHFGLAEFPEHGDNNEALLRRAEIALYEAKENPNRLAVYQNGRDESHIRELAIASDIDTAMLDGQLMLYYQPKVDLSNGDTAHVEALIRWQHPEFGWLPPDEFISVLEQTGNIENLTIWIINEAANQCRTWMQQNLHIRISVNLSALDLRNLKLPEIITASTAKHGIPNDRLILEITESAIMHDPTTAITLLTELRSLGFRVAIDDFGTGYSSLAQLKTLPVDELKIDKSFVQELTENSQDAVIVKSTIELAHSMNLEVIAEGIESEQALRMLQSFNCDKVQGYYFSKPLMPKDYETWHRANRKISLVGSEHAA